MNDETAIPLRTGSDMPTIGLGTWQLTKDTAESVSTAIDLGFRMIDASSDYGTQPEIAEGIKKSGIDRSEIYIVTKVEETDNAYERTLSNLKELQTDYIDLMLIHRPPQEGVGVELWEDLIKAKEDGLVLDIGVSNYSIMQMEELIDKTGEVPTVNQIEWSPFGHSREMRQYCIEREIIIQAYSPLTRGKRLEDDSLIQTAEKYGKTPAQILIRWSIQKGAVPLPKANKKSHQEEDIDVFDFEITAEDMKFLSSLNEEYSSLGNLPYV
jgi:2,5-diketo-D-gluconate reductase A